MKTNDIDPSSPQKRKHSQMLVMRIVLLTIVLSMGLIQLVMLFRGFNQAEAMEQAQIARQLARGDGFTTKCVRPMHLMDASRQARGKALDLDQLRDTTYAPLHICTLALTLKVTGYDDFEEGRLDLGENQIYPADRAIAAVTYFFFVVALALTYWLAMRLFDETVGVVAVAFMSLSDLLLNYAYSGLAQPMMMCLLLGAIHCLVSAVRAQAQARMKPFTAWLIAAFVFAGLLCLTSWIAIWCAVGILVFVGMFMRPTGVYSILGFVVLALMLALPLGLNYFNAGNVMGGAYYSIYNSFGDGDDLILRCTHMASVPFNTSGIILRLTGFAFSQIASLYQNMGSIVVVFFFFLTILHFFKKSETQNIKWCVFIMFLTSCLGMAIFGTNEALHASQLFVILTPFFTIYGVALVFIFLARLNLGIHFNLARNMTVFLLLVISAGPFLFVFPAAVQRGIVLGARGVPQWPPYYPPALNRVLSDHTNEKDFIVTDQPWAVAWYADRKALLLPLRVDEYQKDILSVLQRGGADVQGFLITPSSHSPTSGRKASGGLGGIIARNGDFAPLVLDGYLRHQSPNRSVLYADAFPKGLGEIVSSRGIFSLRMPIAGGDMTYYQRPVSQ